MRVRNIALLGSPWLVAPHSPAKPDSESIPNVIALHSHSIRHHAHSVTESFAQSDRIAGGYGDTHSNGNSQSKRDANSNGNAHTQCLADASRVVKAAACLRRIDSKELRSVNFRPLN